MTTLNPNYSVPAGLPLAYDEDYVSQYTEQNQEDGGAGADGLFPPTEMTVIEQDMHYADDGTLVVDLIAEIPDQDGVVKYDVRISKYQG